MPLAPIPWLITDLTPEVIKALDGSIQTGLGRDGSREPSLAAPAAPEFTVSKTDTTITAIITNPNGATSYEFSVDGATWVAGVIIVGLTAETPYSFRGRGINESGTGAASAVITVTTNAAYNPVGVIFSENFDAQPDWTATMHTTQKFQTVTGGYILPDNWDGIYQDTAWSPEKGYPDKHATLEILASNVDKTRNGTGKSAVIWRESVISGQTDWKSDSQMVRYIDETTEIYAEFYIRFSHEWWQRVVANTANYASKLFRIGYWNGTGDVFNGAFGDLGPLVIWDYKRDAYGIRNLVSLRGGSGGGSYDFNSRADYPTDINRTYTGGSAGQEVGGANPQVLNKVTGGWLVNSSQIATHDEVFGPTEHWTKIAFHVKMNSATDATDGVLSMYMDDQRIMHKNNVPWILNGPVVGWNYVAIGGNHDFNAYPTADQYEDWYALDDLVVRDSLPENLL